jgi:hypothetical protein
MASSKAFLLSFTLLLLFISHSYGHEGYECDHDSIEQNPGLLDIEEDMSALDDGRVLATSPAIRIYPYYGFLQSTASSSYASYIQNDLVPPIIDYYQSALKVKYPVSGKLKLGSVNKICERSTPSILKTTGVSADVFIYFDSQAKSGTQLANSMYCYLASGTKRPLIMRVMINRNMLKANKANVLIHEQNMYVIMHELLHTFGFSNYQFPNFIDSNGKRRKGHIKSMKIGGKTQTVLDVAPLTTRLRNHFGCSSLAGAVMENGGGSSTDGSHFERRLFVYEAMSSGSILGRRISEFSLALLEGSGWYTPNYDYAEPYFFGQGQGCSFVTGTCSTNNGKFDDYCSTSNRGCAPHGRGGGSCKSDSISDGCKYFYPSESYDCENSNGDNYATLPSLQTFGRGAGSKCFTGTLTSASKASTVRSYCFKYTCNGSGSSTTLGVQVGSKNYICSKEGALKVTGYNGSINCPDPLTFCKTVGQKYCPRNCMGRGTCVNNVCKCKSGYKGVDCALRA